MKPALPMLLLAAALLAPLPSSAQEVAGRVIVASGSVVIVRGAQKIPAQTGTPVRVGDVVELGAQSNAQLLLTDDSIISLRPETTFRIKEYAFEKKEPAAQRAFFELVKGGMRTVTGLINRRENYGVSTPYSTIGIRGTHYWVTNCQASCRNRDGSLAPDGDYGMVRGGRVGVSNDKDSKEFGEDQVFHVANRTAPVTQLIGPPSFLVSALSDVKRPAGAPVPATAASGKEAQPTVAPSGAGGLTGDFRTTSSVALPPILPVVVPKTATKDATDTVLASSSPLSVEGPSAALEPTFTGTVFYRVAGVNLTNLAITCSDPPCSTSARGEIVLGVNLTLQRATIRADLKFNDGGIINFATPSPLSGVPITVSGSQITFNGTLNRTDFPQNNGAFRCFDCGTTSFEPVPGFADQLTFSGTITGSQATLTLGARDATGSGSLTTTLSSATPPNDAVAAVAIQRVDGGTDTRARALWDVQIDSSRRLLQFGANDGVTSFGTRIGGPSGSVGTATNAILGTAPAAGNLVWGTWTGPGAQITDFNYDSYTSASSGRLSVQPWITGEVPNTLPPSLGVVTFSPVGAAFTNSSQVLNSASLTADFVNRSVNISIDATHNNPLGGNRYQLTGTTGFSPTVSTFSSGFQSVTCTGPCNSPSSFRTPSGSFGGFFAGQQAQGAGVAFTAGFGANAVSGSAGDGVTGVIGFKR